jgi:hypothetical protein
MSMDQSYLSGMPEKVRVKVVGAININPQLTLSEEEATMLGLAEPIQRAYEKISMYEPLLKRFPKDYTFLQPEPEVVAMKRDDVVALIKFIKERSGIDPYLTPVALMYRSRTFLLSIEHSCG